MPNSFKDCIVDGVAKGAIDPETGDAVMKAYQNAYADAEATLGHAEADRQAGAAVMDALEKAKIEARRRQVLQVRSRRGFLDDVADLKRRRGYTNVPELAGSGGKPPPGGREGWTQGGEPPKDGPLKSGAVAARSLVLLMRNKAGLSGKAGVSAEGQSMAVRGMFDAQMADLMEKFETHTGFDSPNRALLDNVGREGFGEASGDRAAKELNTAWQGTAELARQMFNGEGGQIGKLEGWGFPQSHDAAAIWRAGKDQWVGFTAKLLKRGAMVDKLTGAPFTPERLTAPDGILSQIYDRITTHGLIDAYPPEHPGAGALALSRGEERFLRFDGWDAWKTYQRQFGQGDLFAAMMGHLDGMAQDIGLMRALGPNPAAEWRWRVAFAQREAALERSLSRTEAAVREANRYVKRAQDMYDHFTGGASMPVNDKLAAFGSGVRNYLNGVDLGSAILSDMPSAPMFGALARSFMGVKFQGDMGQLAALLADPGMRAIARRSGFINEVARDGLIGVTQDTIRTMTAGERTVQGMNGFARRLPASVMRLQALTGMFEARRRSWRMTFMGALADAALKDLPALANGSGQERALAAELDRRGFTNADWEQVRQVTPWRPRAGVYFLRPQDIAREANLDLGLRVGEMALNAEQYAIPVSGSLWTRARLLGQLPPGTPEGELARSFTMFKTFSINTAYQYAEEIYLRGVENVWDRWNFIPPALKPAAFHAWLGAWAAGVVGALTLAGGVTLQMRQLVNGKDPLPMNTPQFWGAAMLQGGGLGILGDFFYARTARNEKSAPIAAIGPTGQLLSDAFDLTAGEVGDLATASQHPKRHDAEAARIAHDLTAYMPGASLWWARTAYDRMIIDQLEQRMDPDAKRRFARAAREAQTETGAGAWWPRGSALPTRAPDFSRILGGQ
jgi:hypothetical protein